LLRNLQIRGNNEAIFFVASQVEAHFFDERVTPKVTVSRHFKFKMAGDAVNTKQFTIRKSR